jgi:voltage-gated potassium channel Kch
MDIPWAAIIKETKVAGLVTFLIAMILRFLFGEETLSAIGGERVFWVAFLALFFLLTILLVLVSKNDSPKAKAESASTKKTINYRDSSTHNGDNNL